MVALANKEMTAQLQGEVLGFGNIAHLDAMTQETAPTEEFAVQETVAQMEKYVKMEHVQSQNVVLEDHVQMASLVVMEVAVLTGTMIALGEMDHVNVFRNAKENYVGLTMSVAEDVATVMNAHAQIL
jgi:catalase (peroxidase I)